MSVDGQLLGLAGLVQAVHAVLELAHTGRCQERALEVAVESILRIDADSPAAVFGGAANLAPGLALLADQLDGRNRDHAISRVAATIMHLERQLARRPGLRAELQERIAAAARSAASLGSANDSVIARLDDLYVSTVSTLRPRVLVQGNVLYLSQQRVVARIRTLLLAGLRAAVLWRQMGGSRLGLLLRRHAYAAQARQLIGST